MNISIPEVSIIIPVYNEETILLDSLEELTEQLSEQAFTYELIIAENGSKDGTVALAESFALTHPEVRVLSIGEPNYGKALRTGIFAARGEYVICDEIDLCDVSFYDVALAHLRDGYELVVGSKRAPGGSGTADQSTVVRRLKF